MSISYVYDAPAGSCTGKVVNMTLIRDLTDEDLKGAFSLHITNGHIVRSIVHMLRDIMLYAVMRLTPTGVSILQYDKTEKLVVHLQLDASRFSHYFYLSTKPYILVGISFSMLWARIKILGKQGQFIASKEDGADHMMLNFGTTARHQYKLQGVVDQDITLPVYSSPFPNVYLSVRELTCAMASVRGDRTKIIFKGYSNRLVVESQGTVSDNPLGMSLDEMLRQIGIQPESLLETLNTASDDEVYCSLHLTEDRTAIEELGTPVVDPATQHGHVGAVPIVEVAQTHALSKCLAKVYNITDNSVIKVFIEPDKPIRLDIYVAEYGTLTLYLFKYARIPRDDVVDNVAGDDDE